ncbi:MAG TPA: acyltransferase family protein, partial [Methylobacter sp.]
MTIREKNRLDYLDVLRGIAVLAVCIHHILGYLNQTDGIFQPIQPYLKFLIADLVDWGRLGVVLFFL